MRERGYGSDWMERSEECFIGFFVLQYGDTDGEEYERAVPGGWLSVDGVALS